MLSSLPVGFVLLSGSSQVRGFPFQTIFAFAVALFVQKTTSPVQEADDAWVDDSVKDVDAIPSSRDHSSIYQPLQLIGHRLRFHFHGRSQIGNAQLTCTHDRVEDSQAGTIGKHLEQGLQAG